MDIKRNFFGLLLLAYFSFVLVSCSGDYFGNNDRVEGDEARLDMSVGLDTNMNEESGIESIVKSVRVMIFVSTESQNAGVPPGCVLINERYDNSNEIPAQRFSPGLRDVYVVANETERMRAQLDKVTSVRQLQAINVEYDPDVPSVGKPFVMCAEHLKKRFDGGAAESLSLGLLRIAAKAHFKLSFDALAAGIDVGLVDRPLVVDSVKIMQISDSTMLSSSAPVYSPTNKLESHALKLSAPTNPKNWTITGDLYLTERLFAQGESTSDPEKATHMMIYAKLDGTACRYRINIGDVASKDDATKNYTITRNTQYNITGTITKVGEVDGVDVVIDIAPWRVTTGEIEVGDYLKFSKMTTNDGSFTLKDGDYVVGIGDTIRVYCKTGNKKWYVVASDQNGDLVATDMPIIVSPSEQYINIRFPARANDQYTIKIYHPTIAPDRGEPFKTMTLTQDESVFPNSLLVKSFMDDAEDGRNLVKGWPVDKLPPHGLQVAKRGNVLPSETALSEDQPGIMWSTEYIETGVSRGLSFGESNTDNLLKRGRAKYPAANQCKVLLGEEWYLPSLNELFLFCEYKSLLTSSYLLNKDAYWNAYWSSSEAIDASSSAAILVPYWMEGLRGDKYEYNPYRIRCVRNI